MEETVESTDSGRHGLWKKRTLAAILTFSYWIVTILFIGMIVRAFGIPFGFLFLFIFSVSITLPPVYRWFYNGIDN